MPLQKQKASPPAPLQGERGVKCLTMALHISFISLVAA